MNRRTLNILLTTLALISLLACALPKPGQRTAEPTSTLPPTASATPLLAQATATRPPTATAGPTATPTPSPTPMPPTAPILMYRQPDRGEELKVDAPLVLTFDQAMNRGSVEKAFRVEPAVQGTFDWPTDRVVIFEPEKPWQRESVYDIVVDDSAQSQEGLPLREAISFRFITTGYLEVTQVQPAADTTEVGVDNTITVMFNRPVVPLVSVSDMAGLPDPLVFDPPLEGKGEWLNTSIYVWRPAGGLQPSTTYHVTVKAGLQDTTGGLLSEDYSWSFTTELPRVTDTFPRDQDPYVGPSAAITVTFNQPMDAASVEGRFTLVRSDQQRVAGTFSWSQDRTTLKFTPDAALPRKTKFVARIDAGAMGAVGNDGLQEAYIWTFTTVDEPRVVTTTPTDGAQDISPYGGMYVQFSAPIDTATLADNLRIKYYDPQQQESGVITPTNVYSYWNNYDTELSLSFAMRASSQFTVTLGSGLRGKYGAPIERETVVRFATGQLEPTCYFALPDRNGTFNAYTTTTVIVGYRNVTRLEFELYALEPARYFTLADDWEQWYNFSPQGLPMLNTWSLPISAPLNKTQVMRVRVSDEQGNSLAPGLYILQVKAPEITYTKDRKPATFLLSVARSNVVIKRTLTSAMVWVTDLQSGQPVSGASVSLQTLGQGGGEKGSGTTDADGIWTASFPELEMWTGMFALVEREADGEQPADAAVGYSGWQQGIAPWDFGIDARYYNDPYAGMLYTERPLYRPGQPVYFKGIIRVDDDARYTLPPAGTQADVTVEDSQGREVYSETLQISDMGTIYGELQLDEEAALGDYALRARYDNSVFGTTFRVAEYRKPEYQVDVQSDQDQYVQGDKINVSVQATYYFGGAVAKAKLRWAVLTQDYAFQWDGPGWYDWRDYEWTAYGRQDVYPGYGQLIAEGSGETGEDGRFVFSVPADIAEQQYSQVFTLEATVTDVNNQEVSNRVQVVVHKGLFYVGLAPRGYVGQVGKEQVVDVKVVDLQSQPVANQDVQAVFMIRNWYSVQKEGADGRWYWDWEVEDTPVYTTTVRTDADGQAEAAFTPTEGGSYKVRATAQDSRGNEIHSATYFWVSSSEWISWRRENDDRVELIADKKEYNVGDTAEILVPSPFRGPIKALLTVERGQILEHEVITLEGNSEVLRIPIVEDDVPNVFVSVVLVKGMDETNPLASFKVGYVQLPVSTATKLLNVTLTPDRDVAAGEHYGPRETVHYAVQVTDDQGRGVETELSLDLVDLAVLALTGDGRGPSLVDQFYYQRGVGIQTSASLVVSVDRVAAELPLEEGKGGGGGAAGEGLIRTQFEDTAYWNPVVRTDANGRAEVDVELPDNLTTWRMRGRGVTADTLVGEAKVDVVSTLDVLVRTTAPRFFVIGDQATLSVIAHNNTDASLDATVTLQAMGLEIAGGQSSNAGSQEVTIPAKSQVKVDWTVTVQNVQQVVLRAGVEGGGYTDAMEITLPVYAYSTPEVVATAGQLVEAGERLEAVVLPQRLDPSQGELTIEVDPSLAAGMRDGLTYLESYPYECIEQTVSRWLPNVLTYKALHDLGIQDPELEAKLPGLVREGLQRIYSEQHYDGGWGWWRYDKSDPFLTAYVLLGLIKADQAGYAVDGGVMENAVGFLQKQLKSPSSIKQDYELNRQAFLLYVLAEAGSGDLARAVRLSDARDRLSHYAKAYLALALTLTDEPDQARVKTLLSDLSSAAILSATGAHWEEAWADRWAMNTDTRSTAIIVDAFARLAPQDAILPNAVRWLMVARQEGHWESTQETAWALIALTDYMVTTGELKADYTFMLSLNGRTLQEQDVNQENVGQSFQVKVPIVDLLQQEINRVWVTRNAPAPGQSGEGRLYYGLYLRTFLPVEDVQPLSRGIMVARQYLPVECEDEADCPSLQGAQVGNVVRVKITLVAPNDLHYLVLEDPLPAGCEAIDRSLMTTSVVNQEPQLEDVSHTYEWGGPGWGWWWFTHSEVRDEKVALFASYLPRGTYEYTYYIRASVPGEFLTMPARAYEMYFPEVWGRSDGLKFTIQ